MSQEHFIAEAVRKLNRLEVEIRAKQRHVQFLRSISIDARELSRVSNELAVAAMAIEEYLLRIAGDADSVARRFPARPFRARNFAQQEALNLRLASAVGYRNELRSLSQRIPKELDDLHRQVRLLAEKAKAGLNDPGRWGDAAASTPVNDVIGLAFSLLDLIAKWRDREHPGPNR